MILHVDMDAFYASVEERERPGLAGKPLVVAGAPEARGVVSAANYPARRYGIHSAMPTAAALRRCPGLVVLPVRMGYYAEVSREIRAIFARYTPVIEPLSLDEAFLDAAGTEPLFGPPEVMARRIKDDIHRELQLVASVGVAPNKFLAKLASDLGKPDGLVVVRPDEVRGFLDPLPVERLWGVGEATGRTLKALGIRTIGELRRRPRARLEERLGKAGGHLWELAQGVDERSVEPEHEAKSVSRETTFARDVTNRDALRAVLLELTEQVAWRLRRQGLRGRTVQLKVRFADFTTITRAGTLPEAANATRSLWGAAAELFDTRLPQPLPPVRLIGMGVSGFREASAEQGRLFTDGDDGSQLDAVTDAIRARFGPAAVQRGRAHWRNRS